MFVSGGLTTTVSSLLTILPDFLTLFMYLLPRLPMVIKSPESLSKIASEILFPEAEVVFNF